MLRALSWGMRVLHCFSGTGSEFLTRSLKELNPAKTVFTKRAPGWEDCK
jgi:hypothetical protein